MTTPSRPWECCHRDKLIRNLIASPRWLTVFDLPAYAPELNPTRLQRMQYRPALLDAFVAHTG
jgi:putative transposase